jgi:putative pyruvate formate lyase activating enzyme
MATPDHHEALVKLRGMLSSCTICPRHCRVDRTRGEQGFCRLGDKIVMDCALVHHGEEPPLSGSRGAGTIFFSSCNLKCSYCQNHQISHDIKGELLDSAALARIMLSLADKGCHNIEPVTPTPQTPLIMEALLTARDQGLELPFIYNCGGYEEPEVIKMLTGMVDIYLPDFKYGCDEDGLLFSGVKDYVAQALAAIKEMARQVGDELETEDNIARRGSADPTSDPAGPDGEQLCCAPTDQGKYLLTGVPQHHVAIHADSRFGPARHPGAPDNAPGIRGGGKLCPGSGL